RDQVHAVAQRRHQGDVGRAIPGGELLVVEAGVVVCERRARFAREAADDAPDGLVDLALQLAVLRHAEAGRDGDLDQRHLAPPAWLALEEALEPEQPLDDALGVVQAIDPDQDLLRAQPLAQALGTLLDGWIARLGGERFGVYADAVAHDADLAVAQLDD